MEKINPAVKKSIAVTLLTLLAFAACANFSIATARLGPPATVNVTGIGFWENHKIFDWSIAKSMTPVSLEISRGQTGHAEVSIKATRQVATEFHVYGVRGIVTVKSGMTEVTQDLKVTASVLQSISGSDQYQTLAGATTTIIPAKQIAPDQTESYSYEIQFTPTAGALYKIAAAVTFTYYGWSFDVGGLDQVFALPTSPTFVLTDESAHMTDVKICPDGFTYTSNDAGEWDFTDSATVRYAVDISNVAASYSQNCQFSNTATIIEVDTQQAHSASAFVAIYSGAAPTIKPLTIGYWKNHAGFTGNNGDKVSSYLPIWLGSPGGKSIQVTSAAQVVQVLEMKTFGSASNGITKLYAQLLAAKLNKANGADTSTVKTVLSAADSFLASTDYTSWNSLNAQTKNAVLGWMNTLDLYNNGA